MSSKNSFTIPCSSSGSVSASGRLRSCLSGSTSRPSSSSPTIVLQSSVVSGPTYSPLTDAIGAMSHAPRHSNPRTLKRGSPPAASSIAA